MDIFTTGFKMQSDPLCWSSMLTRYIQQDQMQMWVWISSSDLNTISMNKYVKQMSMDGNVTVSAVALGLKYIREINILLLAAYTIK